jgi:hypothetical protein
MYHKMEFIQGDTHSPSFTGLPRPRRGGLQSPNRTVTPADTTLLCKAWSFTEGFKCPRVKPNASLSTDEIQGNTLTSINHSSYEERE